MAYKKKNVKIEKPKFPSEFGSHKSMLDPDYVGKTGQVICIDDRGKYVTYSSRLDNGLADSYRFVDIKSREKELEIFLNNVKNDKS